MLLFESAEVICSNLDLDDNLDDNIYKEKIMSFEIANSDWYGYGFDAGYHDAVNRCFGSRTTNYPYLTPNYPYFETPEQQHAYNDGYHDGYNSFDD